MKEKKIKEIHALANSLDQKDLEQAQNLLMDYLSEYPKDTDLWLLLIRTECNSPFDDPGRIIHYVQHVLSYDPYNPYALLFWAYADRYLLGNDCEELYEALCKVQSDNSQLIAIIEIAKARYLKQVNVAKYEQALKKSIEYCPDFSTNFRMLGNLYKERGQVEEGNFLIEHGLQNMTKKLDMIIDKNAFDRTSINDFFGEFFAGIYTIDVYNQDVR
jgi:tetratricopeptide (TPR) repeat protein